jgi:hypothetical protein
MRLRQPFYVSVLQLNTGVIYMGSSGINTTLGCECIRDNRSTRGFPPIWATLIFAAS